MTAGFRVGVQDFGVMGVGCRVDLYFASYFESEQ